MFVLGISSWYMRKRQDLGFARRSFAVATSFGLASVLSVIVLGDESGYSAGETQKVKLAAIESEWETHEAPAGFTVIGFPNQEAETTHFAVKIPYMLGLIATRSVDEEVKGLTELRTENSDKIRNGMIAYRELEKMRGSDQSPQTRALFEEHKNNLGHALLLKRYIDDVSQADEAMIQQACQVSPNQIAVSEDCLDAVIGHRMQLSVAVDNLEGKMIALRETDLVECDDDQSVFDTVVITNLEFVALPNVRPIGYGSICLVPVA